MNNKLIRKEYPRGKRTYTKPLLGPLEAITAHTSEQNGLGNNVERPPSLSTCRARLGAVASCSSSPRLRAVVSPGAPSEVQVTLPHSARDEADFRVANQTLVILGCVSDHVATTAMEHLVIVTRPVVFEVINCCHMPFTVVIRARQKAEQKP